MADARSPSRSDLLRFLEDPESYPHNPDRVQLNETHISHVALAGDYVYKIKKPVHLQFLDYRKLQDRRAFCYDELQLNRRLCSDIYERVEQIGWEDERLAFGGSPPVEYAVVMKRLPEGNFLHQRIAQDRLSREDLAPVIEKVSTFIKQHTNDEQAARRGWREEIRHSIDENLIQTSGHAGKFLTQHAFDGIAYYFERFLDQEYSLFAKRRASGCFIEGHGDLRLEHIHLSEDDVCIFDCIEFSERLRSIDFANELAFLKMDFDVEGRGDLGSYVLEQVEKRLPYSLPDRLVAFYASYRAHVRAKVEGMQAVDPNKDEEARDIHQKRARRRYQQSLRYAIAGTQPLVVAVMGRAASGKSSVAEKLSHDLGWSHYASDRTRKELAKVPVTERPDAETREALYTSERTEEVYETLQRRALECCQNGEGVIIDATFSSRARRDDLRQVLGDAGFRHALIALEAPAEIRRHRLSERARQKTVSDARLEDFDLLEDRFEEPDALEDARHLRVRADGTLEETVSRALRALIQLQS